MHDRKFEIIQQLMEELGEEMQYGEDDLSSRLGRKKPGVEVVSIEGNMGDPELESEEEELGMDLDGDDEMGESMAHREMVDSPEEKLKQRLMKLRGA